MKSDTDTFTKSGLRIIIPNNYFKDNLINTSSSMTVGSIMT